MSESEPIDADFEALLEYLHRRRGGSTSPATSGRA